MTSSLKDLSFYLGRGIHTFACYWSNYQITPKPSVMYFELTYRCTCKCGFCERWKVGPKLAKNELTTEEIKKTLSEARKVGVRNVGFTGGEPFLRKDIFEIAQHAKKIGLAITVASNGTLINRDNVKKIAVSFDSVAISMDGIKPKTHDSIRGVRGVYAKAMNALSLLRKEKVPVAVNMVITQKNFMEIDKYIQYFSKKNISLQLTPVHEYETSFLKVKKDLKVIEMKEFEKEWQRLSSKYKFLNNYYYKSVPIFLSSPNKLVNAYTCFAGSVMFFINPFGEVFPCEFKRVSMGNVKKESLSEIWRRNRKLRCQIASSKRGCVCWSHCVVPLNHRLSRYISFKT